MSLLDHWNRRWDPAPEPVPYDCHSDHRSPAALDATPVPHPPCWPPLRRSRRHVPYTRPGDATAGPADRDLRAVADLAALTVTLGSPLAAARHLFAPEMETPNA